MSQSDYIQFKSLKTDLLFQSKLDPILDAQEYMRFVKYSIETTIPNTKLLYNQLIPPNQLFHPIIPIHYTDSTDPYGTLYANAIASCKGTIFTQIQSSYDGIGKQCIFNMEKPVDCSNGNPIFIDCKNTQNRPNRVLTRFATDKRVPITPVPKYVKIKPSKKCSFNTKYKTRICICDNRICKCGINVCSSK